jgi:hypothetical protein
MYVVLAMPAVRADVVRDAPYLHEADDSLFRVERTRAVVVKTRTPRVRDSSLRRVASINRVQRRLDA